MDYIDYKLLQYELIPTIGELNTFTRSNGDAQIAVFGLSGNGKKELINGFDAALGKYAKVLEEFTDRFDFPDGFYKMEVYVPDDNGRPCLELIVPNQHKYDSQEHFDNTSDFMIFLNRLVEDGMNDIPVISPDDNFELEGNLTDSTHLRLYQHKDTGKKYIVLRIV